MAKTIVKKAVVESIVGKGKAPSHGERLNHGHFVIAAKKSGAVTRFELHYTPRYLRKYEKRHGLVAIPF